MTLPRGPISRAHRGSMSRPGAAEGERRSVPEGESGKDRARPHPARTSGRNVRHAGCPPRANSRPNGDDPRRPSAGPISKVGVRRERPSRRAIAAETANGRSLTIGRVSQATSHAASGCAPANRRSAPKSFPPARNGRNARSNLFSKANPTPAWPTSPMRTSPSLFSDAGAAGPAGAARPEGRRRRRRRGRRRERPKGELSPVVADRRDRDRIRRFRRGSRALEALHTRPRPCRRNPGRS